MIEKNLNGARQSYYEKAETKRKQKLWIRQAGD